MAGMEVLKPGDGYGVTIGIGLGFAVVMVGLTLVCCIHCFHGYLLT